MEGQNIEYKEVWRDEYLKWVCGFANAQGGKIYLGKDDAGKTIGLKNIQKLVEDIPNKIVNHLGIVADVNLLTDSGKNFIEISVPPYDVPISYQGKYHYRSGSTKQELHGSALNEFLLRKTGKTWDDVIEPKVGLGELDEEAIKAFRKDAVESGRLPEVAEKSDLSQILVNLRLMSKDKLKRGALLLFGKDPRKFFINAFIKIGKFGKSDSELLSQEVIEGNAYQLADRTLEILDKKYFTKSIAYHGLHRIEQTQYPYDAIREILLNAIVHREYMSGPPIQISVYDDKLTVWNYGILPSDISIEDLKRKHASHPRNPVLADIFFKGGLIESWGRGTLKVISECQKAGLPEPEIEEMTGGIVFTIFKDIYQEQYLKGYELNDRQSEALLQWKSRGWITTGEYQKRFGITDRTALRDLGELVDKDLLLKQGTKKSTRYLFKK